MFSWRKKSEPSLPTASTKSASTPNLPMATNGISGEGSKSPRHPSTSVPAPKSLHTTEPQTNDPKPAGLTPRSASKSAIDLISFLEAPNGDTSKPPLFPPEEARIPLPTLNLDAVTAPADSASTALQPALSTKKPSTTQTFLTKIKSPQANDVVQTVSTFVKKFIDKTPPADQHHTRVRHFLDSLERAVYNHPLWRGGTDQELDETFDGLEKLLMTKLYARVFAATERDFAADKRLYKRIHQLQFITFEHLEIKAHHRKDTSIQLAIREILKINSYKAPRDKLVCILNCCKVIYSILNADARENGEDGPGSAGADEFLPLLIYIVIRANPPNLHSNMEYISRFRNPSKMITETGYYYTQLVAAVTFIETLDEKSLAIDASEFRRNMELANKENSSNNSSSNSSPAQSVAEIPPVAPAATTPPPVIAVSAAAAVSPSADSSGTSPTGYAQASSSVEGPPSDTVSSRRSSISSDVSEIFFADADYLPAAFPMRGDDGGGSSARGSGHELFMNVHSSHELRLGDVPLLLQEYRRLVIENQMLKSWIAKSGKRPNGSGGEEGEQAPPTPVFTEGGEVE